MKTDANLNEEIQEQGLSLTEKESQTVEQVKQWLITNRGYKEYDFTDSFVKSRIVPLLKFVEHKEIVFEGNVIIQNLRTPLELTNKAGDVVSKITNLKYKSRYQDYELESFTKGIDISKEQMKYIKAQTAMLTGTSIGVINKLWDTDSNISKFINSLYFLE